MAAIILFEVVLILSAISVLLFPVETKGRELVDHVSLQKVVYQLVFVLMCSPHWREMGLSITAAALLSYIGTLFMLNFVLNH